MTASHRPSHIRLHGRWSRHGGTRVLGHAFNDEVPCSALQLASRLDAAGAHEDWVAAVARANGCFAVVSERPDGEIWAAVDRVRSRPLFYGRGADGFCVTDDPSWLVGRMSRPTLNAEAAAEFRLTGYVTGSETLILGLQQVCAGEWLRWSATIGVVTKRYYELRHHGFLDADETVIFDRMDELYHGVFRRLVRRAGDRTLLIPLSGGFDSRLVVAGLKEAGARRVLCFTYGTAGNWEARIASESAAYFGYPWRFVRYTSACWEALARSSRWREFQTYAGRFVSVPHMQDWPAVHDLLHAREFALEGIVVPGHTGDFISGGHIPPAFGARPMIRRDELLCAILKKHYALWDWTPSDRAARATYEKRIERITGPISDGTAEQAADLFELWEMQERQAKFICNSVRTYDFFQLDWALPLYDHAVMDFWARVPLAQRLSRRLYRAYVAARQRLPVRAPNTDHSPPIASAIAAADRLRLLDLARAARRHWRRLRWQREHESCAYPPLAWFGAVGQEVFRRQYSGKETLHAFVAQSYLHSVAQSLDAYSCANARESGAAMLRGMAC